MRFRYLENGRLTITVHVGPGDAWIQHDLVRENNLSVEQLKTWRQFVTGTGYSMPTDPL